MAGGFVVMEFCGDFLPEFLVHWDVVSSLEVEDVFSVVFFHGPIIYFSLS